MGLGECGADHSNTTRNAVPPDSTILFAIATGQIATVVKFSFTRITAVESLKQVGPVVQERIRPEPRMEEATRNCLGEMQMIER